MNTIEIAGVSAGMGALGLAKNLRRINEGRRLRNVATVAKNVGHAGKALGGFYKDIGKSALTQNLGKGYKGRVHKDIEKAAEKNLDPSKDKMKPLEGKPKRISSLGKQLGKFQ